MTIIFNYKFMYKIILLFTLFSIQILAFNSRTIGGEILPDTDKTKPWLVIFNNTCSASLIHKRFILTAFHCISSTTIDDVKATFFVIPSGSYEYFSIKEVYLPYDNIRDNREADVAILELEEDINIDSYIKIPNRTFIDKYYGKQDIALFLGYGDNDVNATPLVDPTQLELSIMSRESCNNLMKDEHKAKIEKEGYHYFEYTICDDAKADKERKNKDIGMCSGDSGGPLVIKEDNIYYQIGTAKGYSFDGDSRLCGNNSAYYGNISFHSSWINRVINYRESPRDDGYTNLSSMGYYYSAMKGIPKNKWVLFGTTKAIALEEKKMPNNFKIYTYDSSKEEFKKYSKNGKNIVIRDYSGFWFIKL